MTDLPPPRDQSDDGDCTNDERGPWPMSSSSRHHHPIKSLTVRFNNGNEIWRSPPTARERAGEDGGGDDNLDNGDGDIDYVPPDDSKIGNNDNNNNNNNNNNNSNNNNIDNNFTWPKGWIEVQHTGNQSFPTNSLQREFHPPHRPGSRGKSETFNSIGEVKKYLNKQEQAAARKEKNRRRKSENSSQTSSTSSNNNNNENLPPPPPRSRPRRLATTTPQYEQDALHSSSDHIGTDAELHQIMKLNNDLSHAMRNAIIHAAVLARKKDELYGTPTFVGVNGHTYPDLRLAFGKYANVKQCAVCKQRVQGAFYCRLKMMHVDVPDWDCHHSNSGGNDCGGGGGGRNVGSYNSAEKLSHLFRKTIEELEETQGSWELSSNSSDGKIRRKKKRARISERLHHHNPSILESTSDLSEGCSMDNLGEDLLYLVTSFLPNLQQLVSFCQTSKRAHNLLYNSLHSEDLFRGVFLRAFGKPVTIGNFENNLNWKERWGVVRAVRRGLVKESLEKNGPIPFAVGEQRNGPDLLRLRNALGVLHPLDEADAVYYDNEQWAPETFSDPPCVGYFGMEILHLPKPPNASGDWQPPVALRGDFNGIRIINSLKEAVFQTTDSIDVGEGETNNEGREDLLAVGENEEGGQVLALVPCDVSSVILQPSESRKCPPCCFIGYASGRVAAVTATLNEEGNNYEFSITASHLAHDQELTALTFVNCSYSLDKNKPVLFSADVEGKVYFYPDALNPDKGYSMDESALALVNTGGIPILSLTSTVIHSEHHSYSVLCTGDGRGNIRLWKKADVDLTILKKLKKDKFRHIQVCKSSTQRTADSQHIVTRMVFMYNHFLVTGTSSGDVRIWQLKCVDNIHRNGPDEIPKLTLRHELSNNNFTGSVEFMANIGDVLLTSGGNDGELIGWDINTGLKLGCLSCHSGRVLVDGDRRAPRAYSCVVDVFLDGKDGRLITLCRDGILNQWVLDKHLLGKAFKPGIM